MKNTEVSIEMQFRFFFYKNQYDYSSLFATETKRSLKLLSLSWKINTRKNMNVHEAIKFSFCTHSKMTSKLGWALN